MLTRAALSALLTAQLASLAYAIPGDPDPTFAGFGSGGKLIVPGSGLAGMALQPDGRIVCITTTGDGFSVLRFLGNGAPDPTFGTGGVATFVNPAFTTYANGVAVQPDGGIVVAGTAEAMPAQFMLARVTPSGSLDPSFGGDGWVTTDFDNDTDFGFAIVVQPDGRIIVGGWTHVPNEPGEWDFAVARYLPNGELDSSFGGDGKVTISFDSADFLASMALQEDGKLVLVGWTTTGIIDRDDDFAIARLNSNGTLDDSFDGGRVITGFGEDESATDVCLQVDGKIVVVGFGSDGGKAARYWPDGSLDSSFGASGRLTIPQSDRQQAVAVQPDGRLLLLGSHTSPDGSGKLALHRLNPNGSPDATFEGDGRAFIDLGTGPEVPVGSGLVLHPDGRILASAIFQQGGALIRLWQDGSFESSGQQALGFDDPTFRPGSDEYVYGMAAQADGKLVVAGSVATAAGTESDFALARFLPNGLLDGSFGVAGRVAFSFHNFDVARGVAIQPDGKIVAAGYTGTGNTQFLVARFLTDGSLDTAFGFGGFNVMDFMGGADYGYAAAVAPDGKIVVAGSVFNGAVTVFGVARFNSNGTPDTSFDLDAKQLFAFPSVSTHWATTVVVQHDGKIVVGGSADGDFALVRFNENGSVDSGFGSGGYTITDMGGVDHLAALTLGGDGWIYAAGSRLIVDVQAFALAQYMPNGVLATCPGSPCSNWPTGKAFAEWDGGAAAFAVAWRSDQKVVAAGCAGGGLGWAQFSTQDPANPIQARSDFAGDIECEATGEGFTQGTAGVVYVPPNKIVVAGTQNYAGDTNVALAGFATTSLDVLPPVIRVTLNMNTLAPANRQLMDIHVTVDLSDDYDSDPSFVLTSITSNEPDNGTGDGDTAGDIQGADFGTPDVDFQLRAERSGRGNGRTYTITYTAADASANTAPFVIVVTVPHDRRRVKAGPDAENLPVRTGLRNIQPNPFNPTAIVSFDLATEQPARVQVFDMRGALVRTLVDETLAGGPHRVIWDGRNEHDRAVSSGIYVFRLVTHESTQSRKAVLLR